MLEGEEEIGSMHMGAFLPKHKDLFKADFCLNPDAGAISADEPTITFGLRGLAYFEVHVYGPPRDLHSGLFGGTVHNPAQALAELIAGMHDENGTVTLPGFYDSVRPVTDQEREATAKLPTTAESYLQQTGVPALWGEKEYTPALRTGARPTLEVNGLLSGWTGPGSKTVLPAKAMAKISCRLVPDQDPVEVQKQLVKYMEEHAPKTITWEVKPCTIARGRSPILIPMACVPWLRQWKRFGANRLYIAAKAARLAWLPCCKIFAELNLVSSAAACPMTMSTRRMSVCTCQPGTRIWMRSSISFSNEIMHSLKVSEASSIEDCFGKSCQLAMT